MDAFVHLPALRERVTPAERSSVRLTPEVLARWDQRALELGQGADWRQSEGQLDASRRALLGDCRQGHLGGQDLWVFGYGSLMWDPGLHFAEVRRADLHGHERRFNYKTLLGRGTPERPALTLSLEPAAGSCSGLVFRLAAERVDSETALLWRREMLRGGYCPALLPAHTPQGPVTALAFTCNRAHAGYAGELSLAEAAAIIASASGILGSNRAYLEQTAAQLAALDIHDPYISQLLVQVQALG